LEKNEEYLKLLEKISPVQIACTANDPLIALKRKQAEKINSKLRIIPYIKTFSSSKLAKILGVD
jgi:hypothetical protein